MPFLLVRPRWKALDFAALKRSSVSFFDMEKQESTVSRWARARTRATKLSWPKTLVNKWFNIKCKTDNFQADDDVDDDILYQAVSRAVTAWKLVLAGNEQENEQGNEH
ncbi:hypothetical protein Ahy_A07g035619 [Arachis hypogaea]|uniref:Uncharacterized protein n=1 Tax=Arachis hypogaea TaxID=3818 RepID=A0A445CEB9_ARAHY|nr:hypothetical protein Ahy_A07g035619 [Arachis hypogaea]